MPLILVILGVFLLLFGGVGVVLGWRGRRVDDHPVCRRCRFDLTGSPEPRMECPECGAALDEPKAVRIGNRQRRTGWVVAGVTSFLLGGACIGILASDIDFNPYKPFWLLRLEATSTSLSSKGGALAELERRLQNRSLTDEQMGKLMDTVVSLQASHPMTWDRKWTDLFWQLHRVGIGTPDQIQTFIGEGLVIEFHVRSRVGVDEPIICGLIADNTRVLSPSHKSTLYTETQAGTIIVEDYKSPWIPSLYPDNLFTGRHVQTVASIYRDLSPLKHLSPGKHDIKAHFMIPIRLNRGDPKPIAVIQRNFEGRFELVKDGVAPIELYRDKDAIALFEQQMKTVVGTGKQIKLSRPDHGFSTFLPQSLSPDLGELTVAYRMIAKQGEQEWELLEFVYPDGITSLSTVRDFDVEEVDIIFRPAPDLSKKTPHIDRILDHEFVIKDVEVVWKDAAPAPTNPQQGDTP